MLLPLTILSSGDTAAWALVPPGGDDASAYRVQTAAAHIFPDRLPARQARL